jgi:transcriptional regulator with XRE-family HTH domain
MNYKNPVNNPYYLLGKRIQHWRIKKGFTQARLAEKAGISLAYLAHIETGNKKPSVQLLFKLAATLGIHPKEFWDF